MKIQEMVERAVYSGYSFTLTCENDGWRAQFYYRGKGCDPDMMAVFAKSVYVTPRQAIREALRDIDVFVELGNDPWEDI